MSERGDYEPRGSVEAALEESYGSGSKAGEPGIRPTKNSMDYNPFVGGVFGLVLWFILFADLVVFGVWLMKQVLKL